MRMTALYKHRTITWPSSDSIKKYLPARTKYKN